MKYYFLLKTNNRTNQIYYSPLGKAFREQAEVIKDSGEKQIKAMEDHGKQLAESNELIKNDFTIDKDCVTPERQYLTKFLMKGFMNFII